MSTELFAGMARADLLHELGARMSRISEAATCCGWTGSTGESLPEACYQIVECGQGGPFGTEWVSLFEARLLVAIATRLGYWVDFGEGGDWTPYVPAAMRRRAARGSAKPSTAG